MESSMYPQSTPDLARKRRELAPAVANAFKTFSDAVFADGALPSATKELTAVAVAHVTQCPYCIKGHTRSALRRGASEQQIEAIWVAAEMRTGGAYAHSILALDTDRVTPYASLWACRLSQVTWRKQSRDRLEWWAVKGSNL